MNLKDFIKQNFAECCAELLEFTNTDILPVGKIWEAMSFGDGTLNPVKEIILQLALEKLVNTDKETVEMCLCENQHVILKPNQLYRFVAAEGCEECKKIADYYKQDNTVSGITISNISVHVVDGEVIILFKNQDSLLKFQAPGNLDKDFLAKTVNEELGGLDWNQDFSYIFTRQEYRKAILAVADKMF